MSEPSEVHFVKRCSRDVKEVMEAENQGFSAGAQDAKMPSPHSRSSKSRILPRPSMTCQLLSKFGRRGPAHSSCQFCESSKLYKAIDRWSLLLPEHQGLG